MLNAILVIPATGEVTSPNVPPVITAATQREMSELTEMARGIAKGMINEAAHHDAPMK